MNHFHESFHDGMGRGSETQHKVDFFLMLRFTVKSLPTYDQSDYPVNHAYRTTPQQTPATLLKQCL